MALFKENPMLTQSVVSQSTLPGFTGTILQLQPDSKWRTFRFLILVGVLLLITSNGIWHPNQSSHLDSSVHSDQTYVINPVKKRTASPVTLIYQNQNGELVRVLADANQYSAWANQSVAKLESARKQIRQSAESAFSEEMNLLFATVKQRIPEFSNWYFSLTANYALLWEAITSGVAHFGNKEAVIADLEKVFNKHYEIIVLKPEITDSQIKQLYLHQLQQSHQAYLLLLAELSSEFQVFASKQNPDVESDSQSLPELHLDWLSQLQKWQTPDAHSAVGAAVRGLGLSALGGGIGREIGTILGTRLMMPLVEKGMVIVAGGAGSVAGPAGATVGLMLGFGADGLMQQGLKLLSSDAFEHEVEAAVNATQAEFIFKLLPSILQNIDVEIDDTIQLLLLKFDQK